MIRSVLAAALIAVSIPSSVRADYGLAAIVGRGPVTFSRLRVVLMRDGDRTVMTYQPELERSPAEVWLLLAVPSAWPVSDVRSLPGGLLDRLEEYTAPRLHLEYEEDPCGFEARMASLTLAPLDLDHSRPPEFRAPSLRIEPRARFAAGAHEVELLEARDRDAFVAWLEARGARAEAPAVVELARHMESGGRVAAVRITRQQMRRRGTRLRPPPLRLEVSESPGFGALLGGPVGERARDVLVFTIARNARYEAADRANFLVPTNVAFDIEARGHLGEIFGAIVGRILLDHPGAAVTEHAWQGLGCEHCGLTLTDFSALGGDRLFPNGASAAVELGEPVIRGSLSLAAVRASLERHAAELEACYAHGARRGRFGSVSMMMLFLMETS